MVKTPYHEGEQAVQKQAGEGKPGWGSPMFEAELPFGFDQFLRQQRMLVIGGLDGTGAAWSTVLTGPYGFTGAADPQTVVIGSAPPPGDPLEHAFDNPSDIGLLAIAPQTSQRLRINGVGVRRGDTLVVRSEQALGNCPKYLQRRDLLPDGVGTPAPTVRHSSELDAAQQRWITAADTFFIASRAPEHGADSSHRGGPAGFVQVVGPRKLVWPDYFGNSFYMTLGNLQLDPVCGVTFLDWERGHSLQLTGTAAIDWDADRAHEVTGALRLVEFTVDRVVQTTDANPLRWTFTGPSPYNPVV